MPVHFEKIIVFFHVTKCGGSTIEARYQINKANNYYSHNWNEYTFKGVKFAPQHLTPKALFEIAPKTADFDSFCIIRNPYERLVSSYFYTTAAKVPIIFKNWTIPPRGLAKIYRKFHNPRHSFLESRFRFWLKTEVSRKNRDHYLDQWECAKYAKKVYNLNELSHWISEVDDKFGLTNGTSVINENVGGKTNEIVKNLSNESKALIRKIYAKDFDHLPFSE